VHDHAGGVDDSPQRTGVELAKQLAGARGKIVGRLGAARYGGALFLDRPTRGHHPQAMGPVER
jgi:hypothetical protein